MVKFTFMRSMLRVVFLTAVVLHAAPAASADSPAVAGWIERVRLTPGNVVVQAKLDTGADTSSLHARDIRWFRRDNRDWVAFDVTGEDNVTISFEQPVLRIAKVRSAGGAQRRPTVEMGVCLGDTYRLTQVNLVDRSSLKEQMLIGRRFLEHTFLVDSHRHHLHEPSCKEQPQS